MESTSRKRISPSEGQLRLFTGSSRGSLFQPDPAGERGQVTRTGARTAWHTHPSDRR